MRLHILGLLGLAGLAACESNEKKGERFRREAALARMQFEAKQRDADSVQQAHFPGDAPTEAVRNDTVLQRYLDSASAAHTRLDLAEQRFRQSSRSH